METFSDIPSKQPLAVKTGGEAGVLAKPRRSPTRKTNGHGRKGSGSALEVGSVTKPDTSGSSSASCLISYLFYLLCITSLGATIYSNIRQSYLEDRLFSLVSIEERLSLLETQIRDVYRSRPEAAYEDGGGAVTDFVRKFSVQLAELPRIRRDVSSLKLSRAVRQVATSGDGECMCPPVPIELSLAMDAASYDKHVSALEELKNLSSSHYAQQAVTNLDLDDRLTTLLKHGQLIAERQQRLRDVASLLGSQTEARLTDLTGVARFLRKEVAEVRGDVAVAEKTLATYWQWVTLAVGGVLALKVAVWWKGAGLGGLLRMVGGNVAAIQWCLGRRFVVDVGVLARVLRS
ncbi:hypothetical protein pipiens_007503 [Culex pipiens pipiens]|uniref:Uncharacterized protein n=1 Tax=Culex pipiens pipiens TaxID=38569 RepID=A0ABD1DL99_CULPP